MKRVAGWAASLCFWFAGSVCAGTQPVDKLGADDGAVAFTVTMDFPSGGNQAAMMSSVVSVQRVDDKKVLFLESRVTGFQSTRAYAGALPAGRYRVHDFFSVVCYVMCGGPTAPAPQGMPEFVVAKGEVSLLGGIAYSTRISAEEPGWKRYWGWEDHPDTGTAARVLANVFPELRDKPSHAGWAEGAAGTGNAQLRDLKFNGGGFYQPSANGSDGFAFGGQLGTVRLWNPRQGGIGLIDTGTMYTVRSVLADEQGRMLVGGEGATLKVSADGGRNWRDASAGLPFGVVTQLARTGDGSVLAAVLLQESVAVFRGPADIGAEGSVAWQKLAEFPIKFSFWTGIPGAMPELFVQGQDAIVSLPSKRGAHIRLDTLQTREFDLPGGMQAMSFTADGVLRCRCARTMAVNPWESRDMGRSWQPADLDRFMMLPVFLNANDGFAYRGALFSAAKAGVMVTHDGGRSWNKVSDEGGMGTWTPAYSGNGTLMLLAGSLNFGTSVTDAAMVSSDGGATWTSISERRGWLHDAATAGGAN